MKMKLLTVVFVGIGILSLVAVGLNYGFASWRKHYRQPNGNYVSVSHKSDAIFQHIGYEMWKTESGDFFYAIAAGNVDFEPITPCFDYQYTYRMSDGGHLVINGTPVEYSPAKRILALNPFGELQEIILTEAEMKILESRDSVRIWESVILPRLYQFQGHSKNGKRIGSWTCFDRVGRKAYEGEYLDGKRDGKWTYYYLSGGIRAIIHYRNGVRHGQWTYFGEDGVQTDVLTWDNNNPVERAARQAGLNYAEVRYPNGRIDGEMGPNVR